MRGVAISPTEPSFRGSASAALNNCMGILVGATFQIFLSSNFYSEAVEVITRSIRLSVPK